MARERRGMWIKNTDSRPVEIVMKTRKIVISPGGEAMITADEVRDPIMRENLQLRSISIVRPSTEAEEEELLRTLRTTSEDAGDVEEDAA